MRKLLFLTVSCIVFVHQAAYAMYPLHPLHDAARLGDVERVTALLNNSDTNVNLQDQDGKTPLHWAVYLNAWPVVQILLTHPKIQVNQQDNNGMTPLHEAAYGGRQIIVRLLLKYKADINLQDNYGWTPLQFATNFHLAATVRLLQAWPIMQQQAKDAWLALACTLHPRTGANSQARVLNPYLIHEILQYVQPADFTAIPAVVAPVVPAHTTPAPTLSQQAWTTAQNILSNPRVQIAAAAIAVLGFDAWCLLHH